MIRCVGTGPPIKVGHRDLYSRVARVSRYRCGLRPARQGEANQIVLSGGNSIMIE